MGKVQQIKNAFGIDAAVPMPEAVKLANKQMGLSSDGPLPAQVDMLLTQLGLE